MSPNDTGHDLIPQMTGTSIERQQMSAAGRAADYLFADYLQRRAESTVRTKRAALELWVEYLVEVGAADELLAEAEAWVLTNLDDEELEELAKYAAVRQTSLPIISSATYCQSLPAAWHNVTWGLVEGFVKWVLRKATALPGSTTGSRPSGSTHVWQPRPASSWQTNTH